MPVRCQLPRDGSQNGKIHMNDELPYRIVTLEKIRLGLSVAVSKYLLDSTVDIDSDALRHHVIVHVEGYLWGKQHKERIIKYPCNWREAVKERLYGSRYFPARLIKRFPVRYIVHHVTATEMYPDLRFALPDRQPVLKLAVHDENDAGHWKPRTE